MSFIIKLLYYFLLFMTSVLSVFYLYTAIFKRHVGENPYFLKEFMGVSSLAVLWFLYKAYQMGELNEKYYQGLGFILSSWLCWVVVIGIALLIHYVRFR
jgi:hypothetical protein